MIITYAYLKELYYDDALSSLEKDMLDKLANALNDWYGQSDFDTIQQITGINPMDAPEGSDLEDDDDSETRDDLVDQAKSEWNEKSIEEKFNSFIEISDDATELIELLKPYNKK